MEFKRRTEFFRDCDTDYEHSSSFTRYSWVAATLKEILAGPQSDANTPPPIFANVIRTLIAGPDRGHDLWQRS
jgi:hypothetical protein